MQVLDLVIALHSHVRTYDVNPSTGARWTTAERMADIMRQYRKARAVMSLVDFGAATMPTVTEVTEAKADLGIL